MKGVTIYLVNLFLVLFLCINSVQAVENPEFGACFFPKNAMPKFVLFWRSNDNPQNENSITKAVISYDFTNKQGLPKSDETTTILDAVRKKETGYAIQSHKLTTLYIGQMAETGQLIQYVKLKFANNDTDNVTGEVSYDDEINGDAMCVIKKTQKELVDAVEKHKNKQLLTNPASVCASFPRTIALSIIGVLLGAYLCS